METSKTLDLDAVRAFALVASLGSFTRTAEATGSTQSAVSLKLKRLEDFLGRRLVERTPRSVRLTEDGEAFMDHAKALLTANERALSMMPAATYRLRLGISDHAAGADLAIVLAQLKALDPAVALEVHIGFTRDLLEAFDAGEFDGIIVRQERSQRGGEELVEDAYGWFAAPAFDWRAGTPLPLVSLAPPCGVRAIALRALDKARVPLRDAFVGRGLGAVVAAVGAGLGVAMLARQVAPIGAIDVGVKFRLPGLPRSKVVLYSRVSNPRIAAALRMAAALFRSKAGTR